jgi:hypothetical protein
MSKLTDSDIDLARTGVVWLAGMPVPVELSGASQAVARLAAPDDFDAPGAHVGQLAFDHAPPGTLVAGGRGRGDVLRAIDRWYRREARSRIGDVLAGESERLGLFPARLSIRDQKTRWGSCSTSGTLSFNWRLVIGPAHALRYVVIHELVHIRHHNHSRAFWSSLDQALPDWKRSAAWLRANERALTAYRPAI